MEKGEKVKYVILLGNKIYNQTNGNLGWGGGGRDRKWYPADISIFLE